MAFKFPMFQFPPSPAGRPTPSSSKVAPVETKPALVYSPKSEDSKGEIKPELSRYASLKNTAQELMRRESHTKVEVDEMTQKLAKLENLVQEFENKQKKLVDEKMQLLASLEIQQDAIKKQRFDTNAVVAACDRLKVGISQYELKYAQLEEARVSYQKEQKVLLSTNSSLQEQLHKSQASLLCFDDYRKGSAATINKLQGQVKDREDVIQERSTQIDTLVTQQKAEKTSLLAQLEEYSNKIQSLNSEHEQVVKEHNHQLTELRASLADSEDKLSKSRTQFEATSEILFQQNAQIEELQHRLDSVQVAAKNLEIQYQALTQEHDTTQKSLAEALQNVELEKEEWSRQKAAHEEALNQLTQNHLSVTQQHEAEKQELLASNQTITQRHEVAQQALITALQDLKLAQEELSLKQATHENAIGDLTQNFFSNTLKSELEKQQRTHDDQLLVLQKAKQDLESKLERSKQKITSLKTKQQKAALQKEATPSPVSVVTQTPTPAPVAVATPASRKSNPKPKASKQDQPTFAKKTTKDKAPPKEKAQTSKDQSATRTKPASPAAPSKPAPQTTKTPRKRSTSLDLFDSSVFAFH